MITNNDALLEREHIYQADSISNLFRGGSGPMTHSKTKTSFYRRLYLAYLIDSGVHSVPALMAATGIPRRTAQDTIAALHELNIVCEFQGATKDGRYMIKDWGAINRGWIVDNLQHIKEVLQYP